MKNFLKTTLFLLLPFFSSLYGFGAVINNFSTTAEHNSVKKSDELIDNKHKEGFDRQYNSTIKLFKVEKKYFGIPQEKVSEFLNDFPNAVEVQSFLVDKDTFDIPIDKVSEFLKDLPNAQPLITFDFTYSIVKLHKYLTKKDGFNVPLQQFATDMKNEENLNKLYYNLREKDGFSLSLNHFKQVINGNRLRITEGAILYFDFFVTESAERLNLLYNYLEQKNPDLKSYGFESFYHDMENDSLLRQLYIGFSSKYPEWQDMGYDTFKKDLLNKNVSKELKFQSDNSIVSDLHFQTDKIKVGNNNIELPYPSGFVKVDDSMGNLLETAKKLCPETNSLLAYYISEEDYANYLVDENHICEKYILVEVFNELKDIKVGAKDYRQFLKKHKEEYIDEFKLRIDDVEIKAFENLSKIDERIKMKDFEMEPFGISYESKYSLSYGILSKYQFSVDNTNSGDYIIAALSTITKIDSKPIFLFLYKTYNRSEDIQSLKALNTSWIKEIEKRQSPGSFLAEIDFEDYKESILAILTLSFIWAIYFTTKKIHRKVKNNAENKVTKIEDKNDFLDFNELLQGSKKINDEPTDEEIVIHSLKEAESPKVTIKISNPETLKVNKKTRFFHFVIDLFVAYVFSYFVGYLFGIYQLGYIVVDNQYLFGSIVIFVFYFFQEYFFGKTIGKFITKTHVVDKTGNKPSLIRLVVRTFSRLIPLEAITYLSKEKRGLHDIISTTYVIKD